MKHHNRADVKHLPIPVIPVYHIFHNSAGYATLIDVKHTIGDYTQPRQDINDTDNLHITQQFKTRKIVILKNMEE
jgi:hypothetical protein